MFSSARAIPSPSFPSALAMAVLAQGIAHFTEPNSLYLLREQEHRGIQKVRTKDVGKQIVVWQKLVAAHIRAHLRIDRVDLKAILAPTNQVFDIVDVGAGRGSGVIAWCLTPPAR
jgi:hypothetical protein